MRLFTRLIVCAAPAMLLSALVCHVADSWFGDNSNVLGVCRQIVLEAQRAQALQVRAELVARSRSAKHDILDQLLAGRMSFRQAVVQFRRANELVGNVALVPLPMYQTPTDPQGVGRQVLIWVRGSVASWPSDKAQRLVADLEHEYQTLLGRTKPGEASRVQPTDSNRRDRTEAKSAG
jgi:hypothetical protein